MVERHNRTLENMLSLWTNERQTDWDHHIPLLSMAYRSSPHKSTGETPNLLMLGREVTLPVDLIMEEPPEEPGEEPPNLSGYAADLLERMHMVNEAARKVMTQQMVSQKRQYDQNVRLTCYQPGEVVWLHHMAGKKGRSPKLLRKWTGPYVIRTKISEVTYRIQASPRSKSQVIHGDRLKPCYGTTAEELGFPDRGVLSQPSEATPGPSQEEPALTPEGTVSEPERLEGQKGGGHSAEDEVQSEGEAPSPSPLHQHPPRRRRRRAREPPIDQSIEPTRPATPPPASQRRTRTGRVVKPPTRFGWD